MSYINREFYIKRNISYGDKEMWEVCDNYGTSHFGMKPKGLDIFCLDAFFKGGGYFLAKDYKEAIGMIENDIFCTNPPLQTDASCTIYAQTNSDSASEIIESIRDYGDKDNPLVIRSGCNDHNEIEITINVKILSKKESDQRRK